MTARSRWLLLLALVAFASAICGVFVGKIVPRQRLWHRFEVVI